MLPNIKESLYPKFKQEGYRRKKLKPIQTFMEIVELGYADVQRTLHGINEPQRSLFHQIALDFLELLAKDSLDNQKAFDDLHHTFCTACINLTGGATIHYGQAQKLLNMSLKYWYNEYALDTEKNLLGFPNNLERLFHLPIDKQILEHLIKIGDFYLPANSAWSKWNHDDYISLQKQLRERLLQGAYLLEVDYELWNSPDTATQTLIRTKQKP